jgi:diguanylate cyclase (GGDEF)-like protein/PAS domain S-box-containing protein
MTDRAAPETTLDAVLERLQAIERHVEALRSGAGGRHDSPPGPDLAPIAGVAVTEERCRELLNRLDAIIWEADASTFQFTFVSRQAEETLGYPTRQWLADPGFWLNLLYPEDRERVASLRRLATAQGRNQDFDYRAVTVDGRVIWLRDRVQLIADAEGRPQVLCGLTVDVTEHKRAGAELRHVSTSARCILWSATVEERDGELAWARKVTNEDTAQRLLPLDVTRRESYSEAWIRSIPEEDRTRGERLLRTALAGGLSTFTHEFPCRTHNEEQWFSEDVRVEPAGPGRWRLAGICTDVTERKRVEAALREANDQLTEQVRALEQRNQEIGLMSQLAELLQACRSAEEAYRVVGQIGAQLFPGLQGTVYLLSAGDELMEPVVEWGGSAAGERLFPIDACWALRRGRAYLVDRAHAQPPCRHLAASPPATSLCVPMMAQGSTLGVLLLSQSSLVSLPDATQSLAQMAAEQVALALANLRLRETLRSQSIRDPLTGLFNRRYMEESLIREIRRAERNDRPLGIIMLDIDHFKSFNDEYGHDCGDTLLRELGHFCMNQVRREDIACRYGGEEFILILPDAPLETTRGRAEQLREGVAQLTVGHRRRTLPTVTLSCGVAAFPEHGSTAEDLLKAADTALYEAKGGGRNQVVVAGSREKRGQGGGRGRA